METLTKYSIEASSLKDVCARVEIAFRVPCLKTKGYILWNGTGFIIFSVLYHKLMLHLYQRQVRKMVISLEEERYRLKKASGQRVVKSNFF